MHPNRRGAELLTDVIIEAAELGNPDERMEPTPEGLQGRQDLRYSDTETYRPTTNHTQETTDILNRGRNAGTVQEIEPRPIINHPDQTELKRSQTPYPDTNSPKHDTQTEYLCKTQHLDKLKGRYDQHKQFKTKHQFKIFHINIQRGLSNKLDGLQLEIHKQMSLLSQNMV